MAKAVGDFSKGKVSSHIVRLGLPIMAAELVHVLYNLVDRMFIGHMENVGTAALTGVGVVFPLITMITAFANLCGSGGAPLSSIARGEGDDEKAERILGTSFTMLLTIGLILTVLLYAVAPWAIELLGGDEETLPYALSYFRIYVLGTVPVMINLGMNPFINAQGFPRIGMLTVIIGAVMNIILDPIFIFVLGLGVQGAAIATVISQIAGALWALLFLCGKKPILRLKRLAFDPQAAKSIVSLGVTGFTFKVTNSITQAVINITLKAWGGTASTLYVGAMSIINSIREIAQLPSSGFMSGAQPVMGFNYGAKLYRRVSDSIRFVFFAILFLNTTMWLIVELSPQTLISIFTNDPELMETTVKCIRIYFLAFPFMTLQMVGQHTFVALNYPKQALFFSLFRKLGLILPFTLILPRLGLGVMGPFWAEVISELVGATSAFTAMYFVIWRKMKKAAEAEEAAQKAT